MSASDQTWTGRAREAGKHALRRALHRANLGVGRDPYAARLARTLRSAGVTTVVDVGANAGQFGRQLRYSGYTGRIVSCEPLSGAFEILSRHASGDPGWDVRNVAVGAQPGSAVINVAADSYSSSLLDATTAQVESAPRSAVVGRQPVEVVTVDGLIGELGLDVARTMLKVDTQGFEQSVLAGAARSLPVLRAVQLELSFVELYAGQALEDELAAEVRGHGFILWSLEPGFSAPDGRLLQYDALFLRPAADDA